ncbi:MAG: hypothetical protein OEM63_04275 [Gammaproteobacteria bacterium]|nr:hypothetical protein [Gammaproteobacteria bacterium]
MGRNQHCQVVFGRMAIAEDHKRRIVPQSDHFAPHCLLMRKSLASDVDLRALNRKSTEGLRTMMNRKWLIAVTSLVVIFTPLVGVTNEAADLKVIMQELRNSLTDITDGLLLDDFEQIERGAIAIAEHPQIPPAQVQRVAAELGPEMAAFKQLDTLVHDLSLEINAAAKAQDRDAALSGYLRMMEGCMACHSGYKERVAAVLSEATAEM